MEFWKKIGFWIPFRDTKFGLKIKFSTIFNEFYKITNLYQREVARDVEPSIHGNEERLTRQVTKHNRDNCGACTRQMNPSKTSKHRCKWKPL